MGQKWLSLRNSLRYPRLRQKSLANGDARFLVHSVRKQLPNTIVSKEKLNCKQEASNCKPKSCIHSHCQRFPTTIEGYLFFFFSLSLSLFWGEAGNDLQGLEQPQNLMKTSRVLDTSFRKPVQGPPDPQSPKTPQHQKKKFKEP